MDSYTAIVNLKLLGIDEPARVYANQSSAKLIEDALRRGEGVLASNGAIICRTGKRTGRSPEDKFVVRDSSTDAIIDWGKVNQPMEPAQFQKILDLTRIYFQQRDLFIQDSYVCADERYRLKVRVIADQAWQALFAQCIFMRYPNGSPVDFEPDWTILAASKLHLNPKLHQTKSETAIITDFASKMIIIAGTEYAGEIKKSIFSILNALLPMQNVLSMHCSANIGKRGDVALFFGLSGTGKTTLSADTERKLIGDDEHGWSDQGVFNIEGGCYAKTIRLSPEGEPQIWNAIRFGCVLENVPYEFKTRIPNFGSEEYTENTRAVYPIEAIPGAELSGMGGHPENIFFLSCDAFGVLPPISKLTPEQAMEFFLCGYTAKIPGTETGVTVPQTTFSTCFASPFLPLKPRRYAELLKERMEKYNVPVWLINTGWTGGPPGVGKRMSLEHTRALLQMALSGALQNTNDVRDPIFGVRVPISCPGIPEQVLHPRKGWKDPAQYDLAARQLAEAFAKEAAKYR